MTLFSPSPLWQGKGGGPRVQPGHPHPALPTRGREKEELKNSDAWYQSMKLLDYAMSRFVRAGTLRIIDADGSKIHTYAGSPEPPASLSA